MVLIRLKIPFVPNVSTFQFATEAVLFNVFKINLKKLITIVVLHTKALLPIFENTYRQKKALEVAATEKQQ